MARHRRNNNLRSNTDQKSCYLSAIIIKKCKFHSISPQTEVIRRLLNYKKPSRIPTISLYLNENTYHDFQGKR